MQFTAYRVGHVPLHFVHIVVISHLSISCPRGYPSRHMKISGDYTRDDMPPRPLTPSPSEARSCTWDTQERDGVLAIVFKGDIIVFLILLTAGGTHGSCPGFR
jgi:hypothetical protein